MEPETEPEPIAMVYEDKQMLRSLAHKAKTHIPYPLSDLVERELLMWEDCGFRFSRGSLFGDLVKYLKSLKTPLNDDTTQR